MGTFTEEDNAKYLAAWNAWKEVCWVHGLGKPRGELPIVGTDEDERLLATRIGNAFKRKLAPYLEQLEDTDGHSALAGIDYAQEFDDALCEYEHMDRLDGRCRDDQPKLRKKRAWKNVVWNAAAASDDPPLKVIIGKLLGKAGIIDDVVTNWLTDNFSCRKSGKSDMLVFDVYKDAKPAPDSYNGVDEEEKVDTNTPVARGGGWYETQVDISENMVVPSAWIDQLDKALSPRVCCLLLAHIYGVKVYADAEVLTALGIGKTMANRDLQKAFGCLAGIEPGFRDWLENVAAGRNFLLKWLKKRCQVEKAGQLILSRVADKEYTA